MFILVIQFFSQGVMEKLQEPAVGSIIGIVGIGSTAIVGFVVYFMQKKADRKINHIIESESARRRSQKVRFCNKILDNLNEIKAILETIKKIAQDFPNKRSDPKALNDATGSVVLHNMTMQNKLIPGIEECNRILLDHYNDLSLYDDLVSVERFGGPSAGMVQQEEKTKTIFETELDRTTTILAVDNHLEEILGLIPRIQKEIRS